MPELPEVEIIRRQIYQRYEGLLLVEVKAKPVRIFQNISSDKFCNILKNKRLLEVERFGKFLIWKLESVFPVFHLGMSGIFLENRNQSRYPQHIHIEFTFEGGKQLYFQDMRKFGKVFLYSEEPKLKNIGIDPLTKNFSFTEFRKLLKLSNRNIKSYLMDQKHIAGIGNIYANEALFFAKINPRRKTNQLLDDEAKFLYYAIINIMEKAIDRFGTTYSAYQTVEGVSGDNQNFLNVYQKEGHPCKYCGAEIKKVIIDSRSTFFCSTCQR